MVHQLAYVCAVQLHQATKHLQNKRAADDASRQHAPNPTADTLCAKQQPAKRQQSTDSGAGGAAINGPGAPSMLPSDSADWPLTAAARLADVPLKQHFARVEQAMLGLGPAILHVARCLHSRSVAGKAAVAALGEAAAAAAAAAAPCATKADGWSAADRNKWRQGEQKRMFGAGQLPARVVSMWDALRSKGNPSELLPTFLMLLTQAAPLNPGPRTRYSLDVLKHLPTPIIHEWFSQFAGVNDKIAAVLCLFGLQQVSAGASRRYACKCACYGASVATLLLHAVHARAWFQCDARGLLADLRLSQD